MTPRPDSKGDPIFIVGTGRCGSTVLHDVLATHEHLSFFSRVTDRFPERQSLNRWVMRTLGLPGLGRVVERRFYPIEAYHFWDHYFPGFSTPFRDLTREDVTPRYKKILQRATQSLTTAARPYLLCKITGWPRLGFLHEIFPRAKFIHVYRDGRATASSLLNVPFWWGWRGPENWHWGPLTREQTAKWEEHGRSFVALAAIQWQILMEAQEVARATIPHDRLLELTYEELCAQPIEVIRRATDFTGLPFSRRFESRVRGFSLTNQNDKWKTELTDEQKAILQDCLSSVLRRWGYGDSTKHGITAVATEDTPATTVGAES